MQLDLDGISNQFEAEEGSRRTSKCIVNFYG
jgi:hypothetical protein